jgi:hypothetical protein
MSGRAALTLLPAVVVSTALVGCGGAHHTASEPTDPAALTLRLSDLPPVYKRGDDSGCGPLGLEDAPPALASLVRAEKPNACVIQLERAYGGEPPLIESAAVTFTGEGGAERALAIDNQIVPYLMGELPDTVTRVEAPARIGDATTVLATRNALVQGRTGAPGYVVVWRADAVLGAVFVAGVPEAIASERAVELARLQQRRIENPEPVAQESDAEVALDTPGIGVPVYWLGSSFAPGGGLPALELTDAAVLGPGGGPGNRVKLDYYSASYVGGVHLDIWEPAAWTRFRETRLGKVVWSWACTTATPMAIGGGRTTVYAGHSADPQPPCPAGPPDIFLAEVHLGGAVLTVNMPYCYTCTHTRPGDYNSRAGVEAVVRGLRLRR